MSILEHFPVGMTPRKEQRETLLEVERTWNWTDVFVIQAPVGAGKSALIQTIMKWNGGGQVIVPTNAEIKQYTDKAPWLLPPPYRGGHSPDGFKQAKDEYQTSPYRVMNYYHSLAHKTYHELLLVDEAHNLTRFISAMDAKKFWSHLHEVPENVDSAMDLVCWIYDQLQNPRVKRKKTLQSMFDYLSRDPESYVLEKDIKEYRGKEQMCFEVFPIKPKARPVLWPPSRTRKIVLCSATIQPVDIEEIGLASNRVRYIETDSPIPVEARPIEVDPVAWITHSSLSWSVPKIGQRINNYKDIHPEKGMIHTTYDMAEMLRTHLKDPRYIFHTQDKENKKARYKQWLRSRDGILVGCGMTEALDHKGDICRWQVITKIMFPSLADPAVESKRAKYPEWFDWVAVRELVQSCGRVSRSEDDYGITYVLDKAFCKLYKERKEMFPKSFKEAIR